jgi:hypothetical protein
VENKLNDIKEDIELQIMTDAISGVMYRPV